MKKCKICKVEKDESEFRLLKTGYYSSYCLMCSRAISRKYHQDHLENRKAQIREWRLKNGNNGTRLYHKYKEKFYELYGNSCECCGEAEKAFLCLDHKRGTGRKLRSKQPIVYYKDAVENYDPEEYRVLCFNCNHATRNGRICPHQLNKGE